MNWRVFWSTLLIFTGAFTIVAGLILSCEVSLFYFALMAAGIVSTSLGIGIAFGC